MSRKNRVKSSASILVPTLLVLIFSSCVRIRVHRTSDAPPIGDISTEQASSAVEGLVPASPPIVLSQRCTTGWETLTTDEKPFQFFLRFISLNLYSPWTARVECAKPKPVVKDEWR